MDYREVFPPLLLMAFLQRVLNGNGRIGREYAAGRGRVDLAVEWRGRWSVPSPTGGPPITVVGG